MQSYAKEHLKIDNLKLKYMHSGNYAKASIKKRFKRVHFQFGTIRLPKQCFLIFRSICFVERNVFRLLRLIKNMLETQIQFIHFHML